MPTRLTSLNNPQEMTVEVSGPAGANRLIICAGQAAAAATASNGTNMTRTYTFLVGPVLKQGQFVRAVGTAAIASVTMSQQSSSTGGGAWNLSCTVVDIDADWDDESGQVQVTVEVQAVTGPNTYVMLAGVSYNISILACLPSA